MSGLSGDPMWDLSPAPGWRVMDSGHFGNCYLWVQKKRHRYGIDFCDCARPDVGWPIWDHPRRVKDPEGRRAILLQPFWFSGAHAVQLTQWCEQRGLVWACNMFSPYPKTVAIVIQAEGHPFPALPWPDGGATAIGGDL